MRRRWSIVSPVGNNRTPIAFALYLANIAQGGSTDILPSLPAQIGILMGLRGESKPSTSLRKLAKVSDPFLHDIRISPCKARNYA
jgi:hypothetical protein